MIAAAAVHTHLVRKGLRSYASVNVRSAECLDTHYFAVLIGVGATTVNAYLAQEAIVRSLRNGVISTLVEKKRRAGTPLASARVVAKSLALLGASPFRSAARFVTDGPTLAALYPVHVALGRVMAEFGYANEQYRHAEKN